MNYYEGKRLMWVPDHRDDYDAQRVVSVVEKVGEYCARLDNGWIVDGFGNCVAREKSAAQNIVTASFTPTGYVDDCL